MKPILIDFWDFGIPELVMNNDDDEMVEKIDLFLQILKVTRTSIDLGFLNYETIEKTIIYVIQIL